MGTNPMIKCWWQGQGQAKDKIWPEAFHARRWMTTGFHWEMGAAATEWRLIDTDLIAVAKYLQNAQARLFREVCLAGAKNWIWSLASDRSCHHTSARLLLLVTFQTFEVSIVVACLMCVPMLHSALGSFVIFFRELRHQPYFHTPAHRKIQWQDTTFTKTPQFVIWSCVNTE